MMIKSAHSGRCSLRCAARRLHASRLPVVRAQTSHHTSHTGLNHPQHGRNSASRLVAHFKASDQDTSRSDARKAQPTDVQQQQPEQESAGQSSTSRCPFAQAAAAQPAAAAVSPSNAYANLKDPGGCWRVLPHGNVDNLPEVPSRGVVADGDNPLGAFQEFLEEGAGPFLLRRYREFGPVFSWRLGSDTLVTVLDYEAIKSLLQHGESKVIVGWNPEAFYAMLGEQARQSLENPSVRATNRRTLAPGFTREALTGYIEKLVNICGTQLDAWSSADGPIDLAARGKDLSFEFSTQLLVDFEIEPEQKQDLRAKFNALFQGMMSPPDNTPGSTFSQGLTARTELLHDIEQLVRKREAKQRAEAASGAPVARKSVFEYTLDLKRAQSETGTFDYREAADSGIGLIIAGNDTSGLGVSALLATLALFPDVVDKLRQEQQQVMSRHGSSITPSCLESMPYADAVIKEVLRVAPPSASVGRKAVVDMEICGKFVPAGSTMLLSTFMGQVLTDPHLNLDDLSPKDFEALEANWAALNAATLRAEFKPERWLAPSSTQHREKGGGGSAAKGDDASQLQKPSGLLTFSVGPHACLGMSLFMAEAKVLVALLARGYDLQLADTESSGIGFAVSFATQLQQGAVRFSKLEKAAIAAVAAR